MKIGYIVSEFPGQTHISVWRKIACLRQWGQAIQLFSTRLPLQRDRARHTFAKQAEKETIYLWPRGPLDILGALLWALLTRPVGFARCVVLSLRLPVDKRPRRLALLPLVVPACVLAREARRTGIVHLHSHLCSNSAILAMMLKRLSGIPFSMTLVASIESWGGAMREKFADAVFTETHAQWLLDQMRRDFPELRPDQTAQGGVGVDTEKWVPRRGERPLFKRGIRIITVGRLSRNKSHDILLRAFSRVGQAFEHATLRIIGAGVERPALLALAHQLGLGERVTFAGSLSEDQIIDEMHQADVFVLASRVEALGVVYMEAMAMEVATIGTATGGVGEIITNGVNGLLVPPGDVEALTDAIMQLIVDPELRRALGRAGRQTILNRFDSRIGAALLYERLNGTSPPPVEEAGCLG